MYKKLFGFTGSTEIDEKVTLNGDVIEKWKSSPILRMFLALEECKKYTARIKCRWKMFKDATSILCKKIVSPKQRESMHKRRIRRASCYGAGL